MQLTTIPFSHYCEKARWALGFYGVSYTEKKYLPMLHFLPAFWANRGGGKKDSHSSPFSTPVLVTDDGKRLCHSSEIVRYLSDRFGNGSTNLFPSTEVEELDAWLGDKLGPKTRLIAYHHILQDKALTLNTCRKNASALQTGFLNACYRPWQAMMRKALGINAKRAETFLPLVDQIFDDIEAKLKDGRPYLTGDQFTAADLSFSCLAAPAVWTQPEEGYEAYFSPPDSLPSGFREKVLEWRSRPAGEFALRLSRENRKPR